ncbi:MAG: FG-GAP-like repeat-containing protein [Pseudomonadota bacterium]
MDFALGFGIGSGDERFLRVDIDDGAFDGGGLPGAADFSCLPPGASGADCQFALGSADAGAIIVGISAVGTNLGPDDEIRFNLASVIPAALFEPVAVRVRLYEDPVDAQNGSLATLADNTFSIRLPDGTSFDDFDVEQGVIYFYRVAGCDAMSCSALSAPDAGNAGIEPPPPPVPTATDGTTRNSVVIFWDPVDGADHYEVYRCTTEETSSCGTPFFITDRTSCNDTEAEPGVVYFYRVTSCNEGGCSDFSVADTGFRAEDPPDPPETVVATDGDFTDRVMVEWSAVEDTTRYDLYRCPTNRASSCGPPIGFTSGLTFDDFDGDPLTVYFYRVKACIGERCSAFSSGDDGFRSGRPFEELAQIQLRNGDTGAWLAYQIDGHFVVAERMPALPEDLSWKAVARADFNGDGNPDLLLNDTVTSAWRVYLLAAADGSVIDFVDLEISPATGQTFRGAADVDGDGQADIVFRDDATGAWLAFLSSSGQLEPLDGVTQLLPWTFQGLGDLDGDGVAELLLRHADRQSWQAFSFDAGVVVGASRVKMTRNPDWRFVMMADLTGDGIADVLLRNATSLRWHVYAFDDTGAPVSGGRLLLSPRPIWEFRAVRDLDGNGVLDVVLRNTELGRWYAYLLLPDRMIGESGRLPLIEDLTWESQPAPDH